MIPLNGAVISALAITLEDSFSLDLNSPILRFIILIFFICICIFPFKYVIDLLRGK